MGCVTCTTYLVCKKVHIAWLEVKLVWGCIAVNQWEKCRSLNMIFSVGMMYSSGGSSYDLILKMLDKRSEIGTSDYNSANSTSKALLVFENSDVCIYIYWCNKS